MITFNITSKKKMKQTLITLFNKIILYKYHLFIGKIGEGKTTVIKKILKMFSSRINTHSPTFNYINIIKSSFGLIAHIDLYRIENIERAEELIYSVDAKIYFIEWGNILQINNLFEEFIIWEINTINNIKI